MNNPWKLIFVILFTCEEIIAAQPASNDSTKYDLTNVLNDAILKLLKSTDLVEKLESEILIKSTNHRRWNIKINNTQKLRSFENTSAIEISTMFTFGCSTGSLMFRNPPNTIRWEFPKNRFHMFYDELNYWIVGSVQVLIKEPACPYSYWNCYYNSDFDAKDHKYKNYSIIATNLSANQSCNENITINTSYDHSENPHGIKLEKHSVLLSYKQHLKLMYMISLELPSIMRRYFFDEGNFNALMGEMFNLNPKQHIISACPDFLTNEQRYYYLLPDISFVYMNFKNITIRGLSNFESYANNQSWSNRYSSYDLVYTLQVKNVRGHMTLDPGFEHLPHFQLNFFIGNLDISFVPKKGEFRVEAQDYSIVEDTLQPSTLISSWLPEYSTSIIELIESAVVDSLMPSKKDKEKSSSLSSDFTQIETSFVELLKKSHPRTR
ncbi:uncharacterized protein LOC135837092 [Planococcus citri]|uniref:uncharacterized protein LOC135837092 n=1 Tax=Planococcus citri TaxID=170843 RepID=UPI0031FA2ED8